MRRRSWGDYVSFGKALKRWYWQKQKGYVNLIRRTRLENGEYSEQYEFIHKSELPKEALNIQNYGKYWYYVDDIAPMLMQDSGMTARDVCTWADNNDLNKALTELWSWTNNLDMKKVIMIIGVIVVGFVIFMMVR